MEMNELEEKLKELEKLQNDLKSKYGDISKAIEELKSNNLEIKTNKDFRKRMNDDESYYYIALNFNYNIQDTIDDGGQFDDCNFNNYNYFKTEQEAIKYAKITQNNLKVLQTLEYVNGDWKPDWTDREQDKSIIKFHFNNISDGIAFLGYYQLSFQSEEERNQFRELISDEEIKLFLNPLGDN